MIFILYFSFFLHSLMLWSLETDKREFEDLMGVLARRDGVPLWYSPRREPLTCIKYGEVHGLYGGFFVHEDCSLTTIRLVLDVASKTLDDGEWSVSWKKIRNACDSPLLLENLEEMEYVQLKGDTETWKISSDGICWKSKSDTYQVATFVLSYKTHVCDFIDYFL
jgi:hypothetical protein